jgi:hypothetical protein
MAVVVCGLVGAATVAATLALSRGGAGEASGAASSIATEEYGAGCSPRPHG